MVHFRYSQDLNLRVITSDSGVQTTSKISVKSSGKNYCSGNKKKDGQLLSSITEFFLPVQDKNELMIQGRPLSQTARKLSSLEHNWDGYGAEKPSESSIETAMLLCQRLAHFGINPSKVLASAIGGVAVSIRAPDLQVILEAVNSGEILLFLKRRGVAESIQNIGSKGLDDLTVKRIKEFLGV